ncbi:MAG TPA: PH domain-containing protein [Salinimicrobium sp.]|nr:PH domain-containing protein [Salinimicrobium sp.]
MSKSDFFTPQHQSKIGIFLIFATTLFQLIRNFWVIGIYFLVQDIEPQVLIATVSGLVLVLVLALGYSILYFYKFTFYIDEEKKEFILKKGIFSSEVISIPFNKIQQVNFKRNILQRIIGVYTVLIDTAGSTEKEVEIKALSKAQADELSEILMKFSAGEKNDASEVSSEENKLQEENSVPEWEYKLDFFTLLKLGLTSNYLRGLGILLAFYFTLREQFGFMDESFTEVSDLVGMFSSVLIFIILLLIGMLLTVGETFIKYYNLKLKKSGSGLEVEMGLRENTKVSVKASRVQLLQVMTNPIQQRLNLYRLKISLSSSQNSPEKDKITIPGLPESIVSSVKKYIYGSEIIEEFIVRPSRRLLFRNIVLGMLPIFIAWLSLQFFSFGISPFWMYSAGIIYFWLVIIYQVFYYRSLRLSVSEDFLIKRAGIWIKKEQILEMYKLQSVTVSQPLWYKKRGLVNLIFHSAGGDISYDVVKQKKVIQLVNYLLYKIESATKPWM